MLSLDPALFVFGHRRGLPLRGAQCAIHTQFGFHVKNTSGADSVRQCALITLILDIRN